MREMFPPLDTWNVSFEVPLELEEPKMVHKSGDCGAAQIIFATLEDLERWRIVGAK
jgi:hypothetical protein